MIRLGVNIDHVATLRNARGENYPDPNKAALLAKKSGANSITIHLREDRRHINHRAHLYCKHDKVSRQTAHEPKRADLRIRHPLNEYHQHR